MRVNVYSPPYTVVVSMSNFLKDHNEVVELTPYIIPGGGLIGDTARHATGCFEISNEHVITLFKIKFGEWV